MTHLRLVPRARPLPALPTPSHLARPIAFSPKVMWRNNREVFNDVFYRQWNTSASDSELEQLTRLRHKLAPGRVLTMHNLVRMCFARPRRLAFLPESLALALKANEWSPELEAGGCSGPSPAAGQFDPRRREL